ncbi:MAG: gluconokinase [bacterium]|nr:gluconokinase [bacterium]MDE0287744.1 gluconokinase [bacterium]MDE0436892.1 gluconokinase [bacterium]
MGDLILALDIGTSRLRSALFDEAANPLHSPVASVPTGLETGADGRAILDPFALLESVGEIIERCTRRVDRSRIRAVGGSCMWHSLLGVDRAGRPSTPILTWADTRSTPDAAALRTEIDESRAHARTGCMLRPSYWPAKSRWLARTHPREFSSTRHWLGTAEWLWWQLGAGRACSASMASGTGFFETGTPNWDARLLHGCGISRDQLPRVSDDPGEGPIGSAGWFPAIGDGAASNLGTGAAGPGWATINLGTSAAFRVVSDRTGPDPPFGLFKYRLDLERFVIGGATSNAGNVRAWCIRELQLPDSHALDAAMAQRPLPEHGLTVLPYWSGERAPRWRESVTGTITGIRQSTNAIDIYQAITEATYYRIAEIADLVVGRGDVDIVVSGGGCRSRSELQRLANVLGRPVRAATDPEASLRGAAVFVLERLGVRVPTPPASDPLEPDRFAVERYAELRSRQAALDARLGL